MKNIKCLLTILMLLSSKLVFSGITISKKIIEKHYMISQKDKSGYELREAAHYFCSLEKVKALIEKGVYIDFQDEGGRTALMWTCMFNRGFENLRIAQLLIGSGANVNLQDNNGMTALMFALRSLCNNDWVNHLIVKSLLEKDLHIDIWLTDKKGGTAFDYARREGTTLEVNLLKAAKVRRAVKKIEDDIKRAQTRLDLWIEGYAHLVDVEGNNILHYSAMMNSSAAFAYICKYCPSLFNKKNKSDQIAVDLNPQILALCIYNKFILPGAL